MDQFHSVLTPGCDLLECGQIGLPAIYYGNRSFDNRTVHIIFSSFDQLTISIFDTKTDYVPAFNYSALFKSNYTGAVQFKDDDRPQNSFSIILRRLIQFNDAKGTGKINDEDNTTITYDLKNIGTNNQTSFNTSNDNPVFQFYIPEVNL